MISEEDAIEQAAEAFREGQFPRMAALTEDPVLAHLTPEEIMGRIRELNNPDPPLAA